MTILTGVTFIAGLAVLIIGAEWLVRGASRLAAKAGISPLVIGLTVVAFGTSSPEMAVSVQSSLAGQADIAVGNVVGSNIFNILFVLGILAVITPLIVQQQLIRLDVPLMIGLSFAFYLWRWTVSSAGWKGSCCLPASLSTPFSSSARAAGRVKPWRTNTPRNSPPKPKPAGSRGRLTSDWSASD